MYSKSMVSKITLLAQSNENQDITSLSVSVFGAALIIQIPPIIMNIAKIWKNVTVSPSYKPHAIAATGIKYVQLAAKTVPAILIKLL